jgi:structural maintenance of chromosome 2
MTRLATYDMGGTPLSELNNECPRNKARRSQLAPAGKVNLEFSLIRYPEAVSMAMAFIFGDTLICADADTAKLVAFSVQMREVCCITLNSDVYDPSRTLLVCVQALQAVEGRVVQAEVVLGEVERVLRVLQGNGDPRERWKVMKWELEIKEHEMRLDGEQVLESNAVRIRPPFRCSETLCIDVVLVVGGRSRQGLKRSNEPSRT